MKATYSKIRREMCFEIDKSIGNLYKTLSCWDNLSGNIRFLTRIKNTVKINILYK